MRHLVLADVEGWFPLAGIDLDDDEVEEVIGRARSALADHIEDEGRVEFTMPSTSPPTPLSTPRC